LSQAAGTLSGGEQQMLALGRALVCQPRVLMMDEISMGLAPIVVDQLFDAVGALREHGTTILLVEQYLTYALELADVCYVMGKGEIVFTGEPAELRGASSLAGYVSA
jgi:branched-chain amino acid transport system ATP-binding protein